MNIVSLKTNITKIIISAVIVIVLIAITASCGGGNNMNQNTSAYIPRFDMISHNNNFYYRLENNLYLYDWQNNQKKLLYSAIGKTSDFISDETNIYFSNNNKLYAYDLNANSSKLIYIFESDINICYIYGNYLLLTVNVRGDNILYSKIIIFSLEDYSIKLSLTKETIIWKIAANKEKIFYIMDDKLFSMNYDGSGDIELYPGMKFEKIISCNDKELIVIIKQIENEIKFKLYIIGNNTISEIIDYDIKPNAVISYANNIYFSPLDRHGIYCYKNGKVDIIVSDISGDQISVTDKGIYIYNVYMKLSYYDFDTQKIYGIN